MIKKLLILFLLLSPHWAHLYSAYGASYDTDGTPTVSEFNTLITNASAGDTINLMANMDVGTTISISKALTLNGNGYTLTATSGLSGNMMETTAFSDSTNTLRITDFVFDQTVNNYADPYTLLIAAGSDIRYWRVDNCDFHFGGYGLYIYSKYGLVDNCRFYNIATFLNFSGGYRANGDAAWEDLSLGTEYAIFAEDNQFICDSNDTGDQCATGNVIDGSAGARVVFRYNEFDYDDVTHTSFYGPQFHGSASGGGAYGYWQACSDCRRSPTCIEWYENDLHATGAPDTIDRMLTMRGGTAVIYNNSIDNASATIYFYEEEQYLTSNWPVSRTAWPAEDQVHNVFIWGNTFGGGAQEDSDIQVAANSSSYIRKDYEYFTAQPAASGRRFDFYEASDCVGSGDPVPACTGAGTGDLRNGAAQSHPTDGDPYDNYGGAYISESVEQAHYGYAAYTYPHPLRSEATTVQSKGIGGKNITIR